MARISYSKYQNDFIACKFDFEWVKVVASYKCIKSEKLNELQ